MRFCGVSNSPGVFLLDSSHRRGNDAQGGALRFHFLHVLLFADRSRSCVLLFGEEGEQDVTRVATRPCVQPGQALHKPAVKAPFAKALRGLSTSRAPPVPKAKAKAPPSAEGQGQA